MRYVLFCSSGFVLYRRGVGHIACILALLVIASPSVEAADCGVGQMQAFRRIGNGMFSPLFDRVRLPASVRRATAGLQIYRGKGLKSLDRESFAIFDKVHADPDYKPTRSEYIHLRKAGALELFEQYQRAGQRVQAFNRTIAAANRGTPQQFENLFDRAWNFTQRLLLPLPISITKKQKIKAIYKRFYADPKLDLGDLTESEQALLLRYDLDEDFTRMLDERDSLVGRPMALSRIRNGTGRVMFAVYGASVVAGLGAAALSQVGHSEISMSENIDPDHPLGLRFKGSQLKDMFEIIYSENPDAPMVIRIGAQAYVFDHDGKFTILPLVDRRNRGIPNLLDHPGFKESKMIRVRLNGYSNRDVRAVRGILEMMASRKTQTQRFQGWNWYHEFLKKDMGIALPLDLAFLEDVSVAGLKLSKYTGAFEGSEHIGDIIIAYPDSYTPADIAEDRAAASFISYLSLAHSPVTIPVDYIASYWNDPKGFSDFATDFARDKSRYANITTVDRETARTRMKALQTIAVIEFSEQDGIVAPILHLRGATDKEGMNRVIAMAEAGRIRLDEKFFISPAVLDDLDRAEFFGASVETPDGNVPSVHDYYLYKLRMYAKDNPNAVFWDGRKYFKISAGGGVIPVEKP